VNTVLNRRYAGQQLRYEKALREAKAQGYMARRAIEQRIGVRLNDITTAVGPLEAPATWADDVCHMTGINYKNLRALLAGNGNEACGGDGGPCTTAATLTAADAQIAGEFADSFIGDYVQKLTDFVQYYNVAYPQTDGNDQAVLSLRETLLGGKPSCLAPSPNLLTDPSRLYATRNDPTHLVAGWTLGPCGASDATCIDVRSGSGAPPNVGAGGISWLADRSAPLSSGGEAGAPDGGDDGSAPEGGDSAGSGASAGPSGPDNVVSQAVNLTTPGTYVLSWWDQARERVDGSPMISGSASTPVPYRVAVYDSAWSVVTAIASTPALADAQSSGWSDRRVLTFKVGSPDIFHIAFAASTPGGMAGSVAIADPQLELATSSNLPTAYVNRGGTDQITAFECPLSSDDLRASFQRNCDPDGTCYYDLQTPITINTQDFTSNGISLAGKLAAGNYNFRHVDVALNVAGTGVIDCSQTGSMDCLGSGYLTYTLVHDGSAIGVLGYDGEYRRFDFGQASVEHGKALTAERYITTPVGSADQQLIGQVLKSELRGRPIDGTYHLRIYDSPALHFDHIDDIQMVFNYHYWSRVAAPQNSN
jgi:hypothetical protein